MSMRFLIKMKAGNNERRLLYMLYMSDSLLNGLKIIFLIYKVMTSFINKLSDTKISNKS